MVGLIGSSLVGTACWAMPVANAASAYQPVLTGTRASATRVPFSLDAELSASVDVGTGNLMVNTRDRSMPTVGGKQLTMSSGFGPGMTA